MSDYTRPSFYLNDLAADSRRLRAWIDDRLTLCDAAEGAAWTVRANAERLATEPAGQDVRRRGLEATLSTSKLNLERLADGLREAKQSSDRPEFATEFAREVFSGTSRYWARSSLADRWPRQRSRVEAAEAEWESSCNADIAEHDTAVRSATDAAARALNSARIAESRSQRTFGSARPRPPHLSSGLPLAAFLVVGGVGILLIPSPSNSALAAVTLLVSAAISLAAAWRRGLRPGAIDAVTLGGGLSLALFMAAYLMVGINDPIAITRSADGQPVQSIAEAALLSLTIGLTGGTIGIDLAGSARVVAFLQILLTLAAVATAFSLGWQRLVDGRSEPEPQE